ncbi:MAG: hypothetical protein R3D56_03910 [Paracoccaceae bacterium]
MQTPDLDRAAADPLINHAILLLNGREKLEARAYFQPRPADIFLARRWKVASPACLLVRGADRPHLCGPVADRMERYVATASAALARECAREIDSEGGIPTRNPEELLDVFTLLSWAARLDRGGPQGAGRRIARR